jgi:Asp-tRNA(Asn)/Glu-tRNA(Gln) amidotransferase A subunit family amidase
MSNSEIYKMSALKLVSLVKRKKLNPVEIAEAHISRVKALEPNVNAFKYFNSDILLNNAKIVNQQIENSNAEGLMLGVPVGVKDVFNTKEMPTCMGSPIWEGFTSGNNARVVDHFLYEGGVISGKTVTAEFAVHHPGPTVNPLNSHHIPGTSSSGSVAAVAAGMTTLALGTQTAGSTTRPSSYCGIYCLKPSFGVVPRTGILKTLDTLDHITMIARCVDDLKLFFDVSRVKGENHPFIHKTLDKYNGISKKKIKIAFVKTDTWCYAHDYAQVALTQFAKKLDHIADVIVDEFETLPFLNNLHGDHLTIYEKALSYYFKDEYNQYKNKLSNVFKKMVENGQKVSAEVYRKTLQKQVDCIHHSDLFFKDYDFILSLSTAGEAPLVSDPVEPIDPALMWTYLHVPSVNLPVFRGPSDMPFGAQLVSGRYNDNMLLEFVKKLEDNGLLSQSAVVD